MKLTLDVLELKMKSKKKVLGCFNGSFLRNLVGGGHSFFIFFKGGLLKKKHLGNPDVSPVKFAVNRNPN